MSRKEGKICLSFKLCRINVPEFAGLLHADKFHFLLAYALLISLSSLISASQSYEKPEGTACFEKKTTTPCSMYLHYIIANVSVIFFFFFFLVSGKMHLNVPFVKLEVLM